MKTVTRTIKTATRRTGRSNVILDRAASGKVEPDHRGGSRMDEWSLGPFGICDYDGPETVRLRKYVTGTHVLLEKIGVETGATPGRWSGPRKRPNSSATYAPTSAPAKASGGDARSRCS